MRLARTTVLHKDELWDSANTLEWVFQAINDRYHNLESARATYSRSVQDQAECLLRLVQTAESRANSAIQSLRI